MPRQSKEGLERRIGPASELIVDDDNRPLLVRWMVAAGICTDWGLAAMNSNVQLANMYHEFGPEVIDYPPPPAIPNADNAFARLVRHVEATGFAPLDSSAVRAEIEDWITEPFAADYIGKLIEAHRPPPVVIHIAHPDGTVRPLEGLHHCQTAEVIQVAALGDPVMLVGPAGCGKTTIGHMTSVALSLPFYVTSTVFDTHELLGFVDGHGTYHRTAFRDAFENGGVWVADEIDAWDAAALLAANSALANGYVTFPDGQTPVYRHENFRMIACANTFGKGADRVYIGRNQLDAASLDRFAVIAVDYDNSLEMSLAGGNLDWFNYVLRVRRKCDDHGVRHVVSTRAIVKGSRALATGMDRQRVEDIYLWKGMSESDRRKVA